LSHDEIVGFKGESHDGIAGGASSLRPARPGQNVALVTARELEARDLEDDDEDNDDDGGDDDEGDDD
jgi:hypothetical protein